MSAKHLDCLLVNPPFTFPGGFNFGQRTLDVPLGIIALAAYARENEFSVNILDCNLEFQDTDKEFEKYFVENYVNKFETIKLIGITTTTPTINASFRVARVCKKYFPDCILALGGSHASFVPDESLDRKYIDCVALGEGEETLIQLLQGFPFGDIPGLAHKQEVEGEIQFIRNAPRIRIKKLDELPMPAYDMLDVPKYRPIIGNFKRLPAMMMITSRGCPWSCNFCRRTVGKMWTYRSAESLYAEMKFLSDTYGIKDIAFMDDVFTVQKSRVVELCNLLIENPLDIQWLCFARVDIVDQEMLLMMKKAGCWGIMYGVENFNQDILDGFQKEIGIDQVNDAVKWAKNAGIEIRACLIVGSEGDNEAVIDKNIKMIKELDPDLLSVAILTPFPGNDVFNKALREDRILSYDWDIYYGATPLVRIDSMTPEETLVQYRRMTFKFYMRPKYILKRLRNMKSFKELRYNMIGGFGIMRFYLEKFFGLKHKPASINSEELTDMENERINRFIGKENLVRLTLTATKQTATT